MKRIYVELCEANFTVIANGVQGKAEAGYILGFSYSSGFIANTFAIARVSGIDKLYSDTLDNLWKNFERQLATKSWLGRT